MEIFSLKSERVAPKGGWFSVQQQCVYVTFDKTHDPFVSSYRDVVAQTVVLVLCCTLGSRAIANLKMYVLRVQVDIEVCVLGFIADIIYSGYLLNLHVHHPRNT